MILNKESEMITHLETFNWEGAIRGMRNPKRSWHLSDSTYNTLDIGDNDMKLMLRLIKAGGAHRKFLRQIIISFDVTANLKFFDQFATYEHTVSNSTSQMHMLTKREFTIEDFSNKLTTPLAKQTMLKIIATLNELRKLYLSEELAYNRESIWRDMVELMPQSILYTRTITMNYEVFLAMYKWRHKHKMVEWEQFCDQMLNKLPYMYYFVEASKPTKKLTKDSKLIKEIDNGAIWDLSSLEHNPPESIQGE